MALIIEMAEEDDSPDELGQWAGCQPLKKFTTGKESNTMRKKSNQEIFRCFPRRDEDGAVCGGWKLERMQSDGRMV